MKQTGKSENSKTEIIKAGIAEFSVYGSEKASLNKICRDYGISKGKFYHHFNSKEDLFCACVNYTVDHLIENIQQFKCFEELSIQENLHNYYVSRIDYWLAHPDHYNIIKLAFSNIDTNIAERIHPNTKAFNKVVFEKLLDILKYAKLPEWLDEEAYTNELANIVRVVNEGLFFPDISRIVNAIRQNQTDIAKQKRDELILLYDRFVNIILYGVLPR